MVPSSGVIAQWNRAKCSVVTRPTFAGGTYGSGYETRSSCTNPNLSHMKAQENYRLSKCVLSISHLKQLTPVMSYCVLGPFYMAESDMSPVHPPLWYTVCISGVLPAGERPS